MESLDDELRFEFIIDLGKKNNEFPKEKINDANLMHGCVSKVWLIHKIEDEKYYFYGYSDSVIVKGLVKIMTDIYSGHSANEINNATIDDVRRLDIGSLTTQRQVGMMAMLKHFQKATKTVGNTVQLKIE